MINKLIIFILISFISHVSSSLSQSIEQENMVILPFDGWQGINAENYHDALTNKIATRIIQSHRFNIIDRTHLDKIFEEQGLHQTGVIDEATAVEVGKMIGANKFIVGNFTRTYAEYHDAKYNKKGDKVEEAYYTADIQATIKLLDVQSAEYIEATEARGHGKGRTRKSAFFKAIDEVAENVVNSFFKYFAIQAYIQSMEKSYVIIDRGYELGVKKGMNFEILNIPGSDVRLRSSSEITSDTKRIGMLRIISAEKGTAKARLIGDYSSVREGYLIREVKNKVALEAAIIKKYWGEVVINIGREVGVKRGTTFNVVLRGEEFFDPVSGESYGYDEIKKGVIYVTSTQEKFARAKIIKGRYSIKEGMSLKETSRWNNGWKIGLEYGFVRAKGIANNAWEGTIENNFTDSPDSVKVDYRNKDDIEVASIVRFHFGFYDFVRNNDWQLGLSVVNFDNEINAYSIDFGLSHHFGFIPEFFYIYPGLGLGFAVATQDAESGLINKLSDGNSDHVTAFGFEWFGQIGARLALGKFHFFGELNYNKLTLKKWKYSVKTGEAKENEEGNEDDETKDVAIQSELIPYPEISFDGPSIKFGLSFVF